MRASVFPQCCYAEPSKADEEPPTGPVPGASQLASERLLHWSQGKGLINAKKLKYAKKWDSSFRKLKFCALFCKISHCVINLAVRPRSRVFLAPGSADGGSGLESRGNGPRRLDGFEWPSILLPGPGASGPENTPRIYFED